MGDNMLIGVAIRKNETDYFVHQSYLLMLQNAGLDYDFITLYTPLSCFDGFLIPGGYDIDSKYYNQKNYACYNIDEEMDLLDQKIILYAVENKKPLLGICRGIQSLNVFLGGTLKQDILHHKNDNHFIFYKNKYHLVNSFHHQSIDRLAPDLEIISKSLDNEIEIVKHKYLPIYGVQFHPELINFDIRDFFSEL